MDEEANQYVSVLSTPSLLLNPVHALQDGMVRELYGDATHKISHHLINHSQMSVDDVSGPLASVGDNVSAAWHGER